MRITHLVSALSLLLAGQAFATGDHKHGHAHTPLHGGVVVEANDMDFELVASPEAIALYVSDHGKPASTQGATAKVTLLNGTEKTEVNLTPAGDNKLEAKGAFKVTSGTRSVALITLQGSKPASVRFVLK